MIVLEFGLSETRSKGNY